MRRIRTVVRSMSANRASNLHQASPARKGAVVQQQGMEAEADGSSGLPPNFLDLRRRSETFRLPLARL
jgi:hypothetical protein